MSITLVTSGLLFSDNFNRADGSPGSNYTSVNGPTATISSNRLSLTGINAEGRYRITGPGQFGDLYIVAVIATNSGAEAGLMIMESGSSIPSNPGRGYLFQYLNSNLNLYRTDSNFLQIGTTAFAGGTGNHTFGFFASVTEQKVWVDSVLKLSTTNNAFSAGTTGWGTFRNTASGIAIFVDEISLFSGYKISISGMPSGYKLRIGGSTATESSGTAVLDVGGLSIPFSTIEVLDSSNTVMESVSGTFWPGSVFSYVATFALASSSTTTFSFSSSDLSSIDPTQVESGILVLFNMGSDILVIEPISSIGQLNFNSVSTLSVDFGFFSASTLGFNFKSIITVWIACSVPSSGFVSEGSSIDSLFEDFRLETPGTRPSDWVAAGDAETQAWAWKIEALDSIQRALKPGNLMETGDVFVLIRTLATEESLGRIVVTFKLTFMGIGFNASSAGLGICTSLRVGASPSGFFIYSALVDLNRVTITPFWTDSSGMNYFPPFGYLLELEDEVDQNTPFTIELERPSTNNIRWRVYRSDKVASDWLNVTIPPELEYLSGSPALYYRHNNSSSQSNPKYETFSYVPISIPNPQSWMEEEEPIGDWTYAE